MNRFLLAGLTIIALAGGWPAFGQTPITEDPYTTSGTAGDERYEGDGRIVVLESNLTHPTHADGFVDRDDPVVAGGIVGVALQSATAATDYVTVDRQGIYELSVVASDSQGTLAVSFGDQIYISSTGILNVDKEGTPFGVALNALSGSASAANCNVLVGAMAADIADDLWTTEALTADGAAEETGFSTLNGTASCDVTLADGGNIGQIKGFRAVTSIANPPTVTITTHEIAASTIYTFGTIGDSLWLRWDGLQWVTLGGNAQLTEAVATDTAASLLARVHTLDGTASCDATLADESYVGTRHTFRAITSIANPPTLTITTHELGTSVIYTFGAIGDSLILEWDGLQYVTVGGNAQLTESLTAASPTTTTYGISLLDATSNGVAATLGSAAEAGTEKIVRATNVDNATTLTVTTHEQGSNASTVYTFAAVGDSVHLTWDGLQWVQTGGNLGPVETATGTFTLSSYGTTDIDSSGGAVTGTLGSGMFTGQIKVITMSVDASNSSTVSITNHVTSDPEVATFDALDETGVFIWTGTEWATVYATCTFV